MKKSDFGIMGEKPLEGGVYLIGKIKIENLGKQELIESVMPSTCNTASNSRNSVIFNLRFFL